MMDCSLDDLERLEKQVFFYKPSLKSTEQKQNVSRRLRNQLIESKAVVRIQRMDAECESLMLSLKQRLMLLQDILKPKDTAVQLTQSEKELTEEDSIIKLNLSSDSSDDETLSSIMDKQKRTETQKKGKLKTLEMQLDDTSEITDSYLPLALRRKPRERKLSYKSLSSSASTSHSRNNRNTKLHKKLEHTVTTSGVSFHSEEMLLEQEEVDTTPTLHIKIPSLHRGNVHYIILDSLNFARKVFDYRANEVKQQQKSSISQTSKVTKPRKKQVKSLSSTVVEQLTQQEQELELSQLIQDVMAEACTDETLQATSALENINNNLIDNYDSIPNEDCLTYSQSSQELSFSQNSNVIIDSVCSTSGNSNLQKKQRKNIKRSGDNQQLNEPQKKRGRKPKTKSESADQQQLQAQPPTKSNLAKYVEFFANDCELLPGSTTPAASSTRSQPLVSSTTHNYEIIDQQQQQQRHHEQAIPSQQPITYYIDGDWANGGPCQLVATNGLSVDSRQLNQDDMNAPFQDFVNYIDNSSDSGNNVIARVLEGNNSLPISIPLPITNLGLQNKGHHQAPRHIQQSLQNSYLPVINIQIPNIPSNISNASAPPPAHTHKDVLDLSVKPKSSSNKVTSEVLNLSEISNNNLETCGLNENNDCLPLDLSVKGTNAKEKLAENAHVTIDKQDEDFIRHLIEQSDFDYSTQQLKKGCNTSTLTFNHDNNKSFKAALDMPLLDFDATDLSQLVENTSTASNQQQNSLTDDVMCHDSTNNEDSNYVSMTAINSSIENNLNFSDQSTTEIFNKLLDICPDNQFLDNISNGFISNEELNESVFDQRRVKNSTMCEIENSTNQKTQTEEVQKKICDTTSQLANQVKENSLSFDESSSSTSTSVAVQIDSSNKTTNTDLNTSMSTDMSINFKFSSDDQDQNDLKEAKSVKVDANCNDSQQISKANEQNVKDVGKTKTTLENNEIINLNKDKNFETNEQSKLYKKLEDLGDKSSASFQNTSLEKVVNFEAVKHNADTKDKRLSNSQSNKGKDINLETDGQKVPEAAITYETYKTSKSDKCLANEIDEQEVVDYATAKDNKIEAEVQDRSYRHKSQTKPKENVVFSVAKIALSEDDILYITDSDSASGKSFDIGYEKPMDNEDEITNIKFDTQHITAQNNDVENKANNSCQNIKHTNTADTISENVTKTAIDNENSDDSAIYKHKKTKNTQNKCNEVMNLSVSHENTNEKTSMDRDAEMKDLSIESENFGTLKSDSYCHNIKHVETCDKEPKYTDNDNENSSNSLMTFNETESSCNEIMNFSVSFKNMASDGDNLQQPEAEKVLNIKNKVKEDFTDASKHLECNKVASQKIEENLTLLELESKLEGSLDFDEDFDDALSLTTSCFDSPNDDRFEDSIVDVDTTTSTSIPPVPTLQETQHNDKPNPAQSKDLKHFKIPKLNTATATITNFDNATTTTAVTKPMSKITLLTNLDKITRTVKNDLVQSKENTAEVILVAADVNNETTAIWHTISKVFGVTCLPYLVDKCFAITHSQLNHQLNDADTVYQCLNTADKINVNLAYKVLYNHSKLFKLYFKVFCTYYTTKNERIKLLNMVNDCERYPEYAEFLIVIYESLVKCGLSRVNACRQILKRIRETTSASTIIEALVAIIMESDWTMFTDFIEKYTQEMYKFNFRIDILEQMTLAVLNSKGPHLKQVFGKCVQTLHCDDTGLLLNSPSLIQCVALLTTNT